MSENNSGDVVNPAEIPETTSAESTNESTNTPIDKNPAPSEAAEGKTDDTSDSAAADRRFLIGSQRDPAALKARQGRDWSPLPETGKKPAAEEPAAEKETPKTEGATEVSPEEPTIAPSDPSAAPALSRHIPPPNLRDQLPSELQDELDQAMGDAQMDDLMAASDSLTSQAALEEDSRHTGQIVAVRRDDVFVELGSREQGCISIRQFETPPEVGTTIEVVVQRLNPEDGLYELRIPNAAVGVDDWSDLREGLLVEARITGHNTGGLECEVGHLRGFIPVSQISLYRVDDLAQFVDDKFNCLVTEANPQRGNLVLSRRAVLEREKEEVRQELLESLQPGQIHEGVVRKILDFGAFVDIGGIDGLLHISQLDWGRVNHPSDVVSEGQTIKVKIEKIDKATGKISFAYRDLLENPWDTADHKFPVNEIFEGTVTKLMDFGAFVELERGIEGLVHVSELSHKRIWRPSDVVHEGEKINVMVLSVDTEAQRMSLSLRQTIEEPKPAAKEGESESEALPEKPRQPRRPEGSLKGGLGKTAGGEQFGLKW